MLVTYHIEVDGLSAKVTSTPPVPPKVLKQNLDRVQFTSNDSRTNIKYVLDPTPFEEPELQVDVKLKVDTVQDDHFVAVIKGNQQFLAVIEGKPHHFRCGFIDPIVGFKDWLNQDGADTPVEP